MTSGLLPALLLLLARPPAAQPAPPTCYSRVLSLSREVTGDFQSLQAVERSVSPSSCPPRTDGFRADPGLQNLPLDRGKHENQTKPLFFFPGQC